MSEKTPNSPPTPAQLRRANRKVAGIVILIMVVMAGAGLTWALLTIDSRRKHDPRYPKLVPVAPADLAAWRFLPPDANLCAGLHVAEAMATKPGKEFISQLAAVETPFDLERLTRWTGYPLEAFDHVVVGARVDKGVPWHMVVAECRIPFDKTLLARNLGAAQAELAEHRGHWLFRLEVAGYPALVWWPSETTLVVLYGDKQRPGQNMQSLLRTPTGQNAPTRIDPLQELLKTPMRTTSSMQAWAIGHSQDWTGTAGARLLEPSPAAHDPPWAGVQTFLVSLQFFSKEQKLTGAFHCRDDASARKWIHYCKAQKLVEVLEDFEPKDGWVSIKAAASGERIAAFLHKMAE